MPDPMPTRRLPSLAFWHGRRVLLTGHTGFKGAWLAVWLQELGADVMGYSWDEVEGGIFDRVRASLSLQDERGDIRDTERLRRLADTFQPQVVMHLAAQPIVGLSYLAPVETFSVNVVGTVSVLEAVRRVEALTSVLVVTSDKVYRNDGSGVPLTEAAPLGGHDPYSGSKSAAELAVNSMRASFFSPRPSTVVTARAGNVLGGGDRHLDRIVPDAIDAARTGRTLILRNPGATRPWQHVLEPLAGYLLYVEAATSGSGDLPLALNFGPDPTQATETVEKLVAGLFVAMGCGAWESATSTAFAEASMLSLDSSLAIKTLGWQPCWTTSDALASTWDWEEQSTTPGDLYAPTASQIASYGQGS